MQSVYNYNYNNNIQNNVLQHHVLQNHILQNHVLQHHVLQHHQNTKLTYNIPYNSIWFETEKSLTLEQYIKKQINIAKTHLNSNINYNKNIAKAVFVPDSYINSSGLCSASSYYELYKQSQSHTPIKRFIIFCTDHSTPDTKSLNTFITTSYTDIASYTSNSSNNNIDNIKIDQKSIAKINKYISIDNERFDNEHSFFVQIPYIETLFKKTSIAKNDQILILPFIISNKLNLLDKENSDKIRGIMKFLKELLLNDDTVLICVSNLSQINGQYHHKIKSYIYQNIKKEDNIILQFLYNEINGIKTRNYKIDDILFIQNAPSDDIMTIYLFGKLLNSLCGSLNCSTYSSSSDSSIDSNNSINKNYINNTIIYPRITCYYTSLIRNHIDLFNFKTSQLTTVLNIENSTVNTTSSISFVSLIFTSQPNIELTKLRNIENLLSEYEKINLIGFTKEYINNKSNSNSNSDKTNKKIPLHIIYPINSPIYKYNFSICISIIINDILYKYMSSNNYDDNNDNNNNDNNNNDNNYNNDYTIVNNIKQIIDNQINYNLDINKCSFNINILNKLIPLTINEYLTDKFKMGNDVLILQKQNSNDNSNNNSNNNSNKYIHTLTDNNCLQTKKQLLENLYKQYLGISLQDYYRKENQNIQLFYNEGLQIVNNIKCM